MEIKEPELHSKVIEADFFKSVGYSTVWEDERVISEGLQPGPHENVFSITSGGCFSLQFLLYDVHAVLSLDFNQNQSALLELKRSAILALDHEELWEFLGFAPSKRRPQLYAKVRTILSGHAQQIWDRQTQAVAQGVSLQGKQDKYLHLVGKLIRLWQGKKKVDTLLSCAHDQQQRAFFDNQWNSWRWKLLCGLVFNRVVLNKAFAKEHFTYSKEEHPAYRMRKEAERALYASPGAQNFYLYYLFHSSYPSRELCPAWLRQSNHSLLRDRLDRLEIRTGQFEQVLGTLPPGSMDCFNLSNIFDWVSEADFVRMMKQLVRAAKPGARLCYWTNVINTKRHLAATGIQEITELTDLSKRLSDSSRTPGYSGCVVARIDKPK